jgi:hypothetical protein
MRAAAVVARLRLSDQTVLRETQYRAVPAVVVEGLRPGPARSSGSLVASVDSVAVAVAADRAVSPPQLPLTVRADAAGLEASVAST